MAYYAYFKKTVSKHCGLLCETLCKLSVLFICKLIPSPNYIFQIAAMRFFQVGHLLLLVDEYRIPNCFSVELYVIHEFHNYLGQCYFLIVLHI